MKKESNFELLRIISMVLIVFHHYAVHTPWVYKSGISVEKISIQIFSLGGKIGVNCFILITAFFLSRRTNISYTSLKKTWSITLFYSILISIIGIVFFDNISKFEILKGFFPVITNQYWFVTSYIALLFFIPILNAAVNNMDPKIYRKTLIILFVFLSILSSIPGIEAFSNSILWFIFLYLAGAYIQLYYDDNYSSRYYLSGVLFGLGLLLILLIFLDLLSGKFVFFQTKELSIVKNNQNFLSFYVAISLFLFIKNTNINYSLIVNRLGSTMFSVYLIHDNPIIRNILWSSILKCIKTRNSFSIILLGIVSTFLIMIISILFDLVRQRMFFAINKFRKTIILRR